MKQLSFKNVLFSTLCLITVSQLTIASPRFDERLMSEEEFFELMAESNKDFENPKTLCEEDLAEVRSINTKKPFTIMVFMAADNDLHPFAQKNIKQMELIGSNENVNIVVQLNTPGYLVPTKRYLVKKGRRILIQDSENPTQKLNSGNPYTLIDFAEWATTHYPADEYALILWNHGSGAIDPGFGKTINPCELFYCNPSNNMLEIDRGLSYINLILQSAQKNVSEINKGICFDETFKSYINNQDFEFALHEIHTKVLHGKKLGIVAFDACLMSMIEIANISKKYAKYMVGSQEVEYGTGWNYEYVLKPFSNKSLSAREFSEHIVHSYEQAYHRLINDYTQSALDLELCQDLEDNLHAVSNLLVEALVEQSHHNIINILRKCKSTQHCTCFDEPSYIDIGHFYKNILHHLQYFTLKNKQKEQNIQSSLKVLLEEGLRLIAKFVIENKTGNKLKNAHGISICFPEYGLPNSYSKSNFSRTNNWSLLLTKYFLG